jgi:tRNA pseudouridine38-40 synthase
MVRRMVGSLVQVGSGRMTPAALAGLLSDPTAPAESPARFTAPPSGLFLESVEYPGEPPLGDPAPAFPVGAAVPAASRFVGHPTRRK